MRQAEQIHLSQDGSHTLYSEKYKAHYHSVFGAVDESVHVFICAGLYYLARAGYRSISIFEMGLGTGLNALLSLLEAEKYNIEICYHSIESDPLDTELAAQLNYSAILGCDPELLLAIHQAEADTITALTPYFSIKKHIGSIEDFKMDSCYDLVYWDAFAPECQSFLWERELHSKVYQSLKDYGILVSYCTKGSFKRALRDIGYRLETLSGPGKKREMLRACKAIAQKENKPIS